VEFINYKEHSKMHDKCALCVYPTQMESICKWKETVGVTEDCQYMLEPSWKVELGNRIKNNPDSILLNSI